MAGYSAAIKLNNLVTTSLTTVGNGISNYTAQNLGAGKRKRVGEGFKSGVLMVWIICIPITILYCLLGKSLIHIFLDNPSQDALATGKQILLIISPFYVILALKLVADGVLRGAGMMNKFMIATFVDLILRVVLAKVLAGTSLGAKGIWCAWPIGWVIATILSVVFYMMGHFNKDNDKSLEEEISEM